MDIPPATSESLMDVDEDTRPMGLQLNFVPGEQIPLKGIWFEVTDVTFDRLVLKPLGETWKHYKKRTGRG